MVILTLLVLELLVLPLVAEPPFVLFEEVALPLDELCEVELLTDTLLLLVDVLVVVLTMVMVLMLP